MNRRQVGLVVLVVLGVVTVGLTVPLTQNRLVRANADTVEVAVTDTRVVNGTEETTLVLSVDVSNPTRRSLTVPEQVAYGGLSVRPESGDRAFVQRRVAEIESGEVPAGGSTMVTVRFPVRDAYTGRIGGLLDGAVLAGQFPVELDGRVIEVEVDTPVRGESQSSGASVAPSLPSVEPSERPSLTHRATGGGR
jgi:hypothetical protein